MNRIIKRCLGVLVAIVVLVGIPAQCIAQDQTKESRLESKVVIKRVISIQESIRKITRILIEARKRQEEQQKEQVVTTQKATTKTTKTTKVTTITTTTVKYDSKYAKIGSECANAPVKTDSIERIIKTQAGYHNISANFLRELLKRESGLNWCLVTNLNTDNMRAGVANLRVKDFPSITADRFFSIQWSIEWTAKELDAGRNHWASYDAVKRIYGDPHAMR